MRHHIFESNEYYPVAILMKPSAFNKQELINNYVEPLRTLGVSLDNVIAFTLDYNEQGKAPAGHIKEYLLGSLLPALTSLKTKYLYCTDAAFFKVLTGQAKAEPHFGYVLPCKLKDYEHMKVVLGLNYQQLIYNPDLKPKLETTLQALASDMQGSYQAPGTGIIHQAIYPEGLQAIQEALMALLEYPTLTCDIETFSLRFNEAGIGTIAFAIDKHRGLSFCCDYRENIPLVPLAEKRQEHGRFVPNPEVRKLLRWFFENYTGKLIFHRATFDVKVLIYILWMEDLLDTKGMLEGLDTLTRSIDDTLIIAYLATNSTAGNVLGLKPLAHEFAGNWAVEEIKDIKLVPKQDLLQYNLVDCLSTWYVHDKYYPIMVQDRQEALYKGLMLDSLKLILQIELVGMPMNKAKVDEIEVKLKEIEAKHLNFLMQHATVKQFEDWKTEQEWIKDYETRKAKAKNPDKIKPKDRATYPRFVFNPGSAQQLQILLYEMLGLPVIDRTETKQPATGEKTLAKLLDHPIGKANKDLLEAIIGISQVSTILSTFLPAFKKAIVKDDSGIVWLHGSFNIGGTVSGRLSSSDPNMQNIPAKSIFAKLIKECFMAAFGWLFCGADFNSLEDMISALTTKDPNKLKVYTDGFDGHSLRAAYYFKDELIAQGINIDITNPKSVNQLKKMDHPLRQESKAPTFALTYQGTYHTLMANLGWAKDKAMAIETNYHVLYVESDRYVQDRLKQASIDGYVEVAFGLRIRAPLLKQVVWGSSSMPYEAAAEGRTIGNALGQSWGLLNNRAAAAFMQRVWASQYRYDILPCALIHDAIYLLVRDRPDVVEWANRALIEEMRWQDHPEIDHPTVKLGAALDIFWPSWANAITLPNDADQDTIIKVCTEAMQEYRNSKSKE